jgi:hypothetical protein
VNTNIPEKLLKVAAEIKEFGSAGLTRLTILKKWFGEKHRLSSFAIFVAKQSCVRKGRETGETADLFREARSLLIGAKKFCPQVPRNTASSLHARLRAFQNEYKRLRWGSARIIYNRNLFLIEEGFRVYLWHADSPSEGYHLAAAYCEHYDPRYGNALTGSSYSKIYEIVRFMFTIEAHETDEDPRRKAGVTETKRK